MKEYINSQHRYYSLDYYLKNKYKSKVFKVALNGNFTCPNRDGKISHQGCIFCSPSGSGDFAGNKKDTLEIQFKTVSSIIHQKWQDAFYIVYFQANTNTYKPLNELQEMFEKAIKLDPKIIAISIATRPDCLPDDVLEYLNDLNKRIPVWLELGLQTSNDNTAKFINRGYDLDVFIDCVKRIRKYNIETIVHIINGLPFETENDMYETVRFLNSLDIQGIKIHSLFVLENTPLAKVYQEENFKMLTLEEYVKITAEQLAILRDDIVIHRINGDAPKDLLIAPLWSIKKLVVMNEIDKYMRNNQLYQGKYYKNN